MIDIALINWKTEFSEDSAQKNFEQSARYRGGILEYVDQFLREPPTGLMLLAQILEKKGYSVEIVDCTILEDPIGYLKYQAPKYRFVGLTALTNTFSAVMELASIMKNANPNLFLTLGGPHVSFEYQRILIQYPFVDMIFVGEAENSLPWVVEQLLIKPYIDFVYDNETHLLSQSLNSKELFFQRINQTPSKPKGITFLDQTPTEDGVRQVLYSGFPEPTNLDQLPLPARHLISRVYSVADIIVNRGCPNQCSFCSRTKLFPKMRIRSVEQVMQEVDYILSGSTYRFINFYDNININHKYFNYFLDELIAREKMLPWGAELRADVITSEEAHKVRQSNGKLIATGIESASPEVLRTNFKFQNPDKVAEGIHIMKNAGIAIQAYFVIGLPGDTPERFQQTLEFAEQLPFEKGIDHVNFFVTTPYPGSDLVLHPEKYGITVINTDYDQFNCHEVLMETETLNKSQVLEMITKANALKKKLGI
ncbi:radical SAM protein [Candidatus Lokiarchaeum ossiferum]|uniref:radical SAM protein n=1 Tax=Candidatus Lokiarchaeum ossiferum TaxID=2951803 RepID=UPI00352C56F7